MKKPYTVVCMERSSPLPPVYPDPLIYNFELDLVDLDDESKLKRLVAEERVKEVYVGSEFDFEEIAAGIQIVVVFPGDLYPVADFRT